MHEGDYLYYKADKKYSPLKKEFLYPRNIHDALKKPIKHVEEKEFLFLNKRIYNKGLKYANKSTRMNTEVYEEFSSFCEEYYSHLKMQDVIGF